MNEQHIAPGMNSRLAELERRFRLLSEECRVHRDMTLVLRRELIKTQARVQELETELRAAQRGIRSVN